MASAQLTGPDFEAPLIEHEGSEGGTTGGVEVINASVVDNDELASVQLFYRFIGETEFTRINMRQIASSSNFTARVSTASVGDSYKGIEYYIRAEDVAGNLVLKGFAFQPLVRQVETVPRSEPTEPTAEVIDKSNEINWLYVALGVLVVGGIAAAAGGSDGGGEPVSSDCVNGCAVTLTANPPLDP